MRHQNRGKCKLMVSMLGEMGYVVDVIEKHNGASGRGASTTWW